MITINVDFESNSTGKFLNFDRNDVRKHINLINNYSFLIPIRIAKYCRTPKTIMMT